jgi:hypothetical protein
MELEFRYNFRANLDEILSNVLGGIKRAITKINIIRRKYGKLIK